MLAQSRQDLLSVILVVVADSSPLHYLLPIEAVDILQSLYSRVMMPQTVAAELQVPSAPAAVRSWISQPPEWCEILPDPHYEFAIPFLDAGKSADILLAATVPADRVLIYERAGREEARRRHWNVRAIPTRPSNERNMPESGALFFGWPRSRGYQSVVGRRIRRPVAGRVVCYGVLRSRGPAPSRHSASR